MTEIEVKHVAKDAAREALQEFMLMLGVDVSTGASVVELQKDFAHVRAERLTIGRARDKIMTAFTGSVVTFVIGAVGYYVVHIR